MNSLAEALDLTPSVTFVADYDADIRQAAIIQLVLQTCINTTAAVEDTSP